ncbi:MAG: 1-deoxy-D-xylulose-5-phosphate reductoisomerase [Clostridiales bacterium]|nr:1-deoxy-D-xylulose-5-phosphate reductoisomerase [Clostridiales bacterium]
MRKRIAILGSTGSIGTQALDIIKTHKDKFEVVALSAHKNIALLKEQMGDFKPEQVTITDTKCYNTFLKDNKYNITLNHGLDGLKEMISSIDIDIVLIAIVGVAALEIAHYILDQGIDIALANKECIVAGGELLISKAKDKGARIIPVDSEHSAIFQCLQGCEDDSDIKNIYLTASGGPFKDMDIDNLHNVTPAQALRHPNWDMGNKITIDSATLMNKGLEVIEAKWLFNLDIDRVKVVVHPQSIVHSMVEFIDNSIIANMGVPDMRLPILYAFTYPRRLDTDIELNLYEMGNLTFERPDMVKFPCLSLAYEAMRIGGSMPIALNAGNEIAVYKFLEGDIGFTTIPKMVEKAMNIHLRDLIHDPTLEQVLYIDKSIREQLV